MPDLVLVIVLMIDPHFCSSTITITRVFRGEKRAVASSNGQPVCFNSSARLRWPARCPGGTRGIDPPQAGIPSRQRQRLLVASFPGAVHRKPPGFPRTMGLYLNEIFAHLANAPTDCGQG